MMKIIPLVTLFLVILIAGCIQLQVPEKPATSDVPVQSLPTEEPATAPVITEPVAQPKPVSPLPAAQTSATVTPTGTKIVLPEPVYHLTMDTEKSADGKIISYSKGASKTTKLLGKINNAWNFDGSNDIVILTDKRLQSLNEFTIVLWLKPGDLLKRAHILWQGDEDKETRAENAGNGWGPHQEMHLSLGDEIGMSNYRINKLTFYVGDDKHNLKVSTEMNTREWQHIAIIVRNANTKPTAELVIDTVSRGTATASSAIKRDKWGTLRFGTAGRAGQPGDSDRDFRGSIDEFAIYDRALTSNELAKLCLRQNAGKTCNE